MRKLKDIAFEWFGGAESINFYNNERINYRAFVDDKDKLNTLLTRSKIVEALHLTLGKALPTAISGFCLGSVLGSGDSSYLYGMVTNELGVRGLADLVFNGFYQQNIGDKIDDLVNVFAQEDTEGVEE